MKQELETQDIELLIAQARRYRSEATGRLIAEGSRRFWQKFLHVADRGLHLLLMSPDASRR